MNSKILPDIVIFTNGNLFSKIILDKFISKYKSRICMIVIVTGDYYGNRGIHALIEFSKLTSWIYVFYKIWTIMMIKLLNGGNKTAIASVEKLCKSSGISYCFTADINEAPLFEQIKGFSPGYLISVSCPQLIRKKWLDLFNGKGINIHGSLLPRYAGLAPYFWVLVNNEKETGISVHYLIKGFDKGNILSYSKIDIDQGTSSFRLFLKLCIEGQRILPEAFEKMLVDDPGTVQDQLSFSYFSHATSRAYIHLKRNGFSLFDLKDFNYVKKFL